MARSSKGAGNFLLPLGLAAAVVVGLLFIVFGFSSETPPDEPTVIAEDDVDARPAGAGTAPEGEADAQIEGISEEMDDVEPASGDAGSVPPAEGSEQAAEDDVGDPSTAITRGESTGSETAEPREGDGEQAGNGELPEGRDADTELTPEDGQGVVRDTDDGGSAFVPTPSGPEGRDDETIAD